MLLLLACVPPPIDVPEPTVRAVEAPAPNCTLTPTWTRDEPGVVAMSGAAWVTSSALVTPDGRVDIDGKVVGLAPLDEGWLVATEDAGLVWVRGLEVVQTRHRDRVWVDVDTGPAGTFALETLGARRVDVDTGDLGPLTPTWSGAPVLDLAVTERGPAVSYWPIGRVEHGPQLWKVPSATWLRFEGHLRGAAVGHGVVELGDPLVSAPVVGGANDVLGAWTATPFGLEGPGQFCPLDPVLKLGQYRDELRVATADQVLSFSVFPWEGEDSSSE